MGTPVKPSKRSYKLNRTSCTSFSLSTKALRPSLTVSIKASAKPDSRVASLMSSLLILALYFGSAISKPYKKSTKLRPLSVSLYPTL